MKDNRPPKEGRTLKRGDARADGMVFYGYSETSATGERWVTAEKLEAIKGDRNRYNRESYGRNREKILRRTNEYKKKNIKAIKKRNAEYYIENSDRVKATAALWVKENRGRANKQRRERTASDPSFKLSCNMRTRVSAAIKGQFAMKRGKTFELVGCTAAQLRSWLESQFTEGMTWENYGKWHIDHIKPCASFDLTLDEEQKKCFHYTNLQPLWATDNLKKSDKWTGG